MVEQEAAKIEKPEAILTCEECKSKPSKYKCPGCFVRSCSLACVKAHKQRTSCNGKRHQTQFVHQSQFDDNILLSDYNLLEEVKRVADSAQRTRVNLCGHQYFKPPFHLRSLRSAAHHLRTKLLFLPSGMSKREKNKSRYDQRNKVISWTIEWRFHSTDVVLVDHGVCDNTTLAATIENHLKPGPWNHTLKKFCEEKLDNLKFFIRKYPKGISPFRELDINAPISQQLANTIILEYPVIHVFLPSHNYDFEVVKDIKPQPPKQVVYNDGMGSNDPSLKGVLFKEEEIDDGSSSDPLVLDLMNYMKPENGSEILNIGQTEIEMNNFPDKVERMDHLSEECKTTSNVLDNMDFELDQELLNLISDINPEEFFDWEGGFAKEIESGCHSDFGPLSPVEEDLEEGEITEL